MLKNTRLSLTEIAYTCGFADQGHFTRTFKAATGFLPKTFRKI
jgi:AraC family transcriptional regulator